MQPCGGQSHGCQSIVLLTMYLHLSPVRSPSGPCEKGEIKYRQILTGRFALNAPAQSEKLRHHKHGWSAGLSAVRTCQIKARLGVNSG